MISLKSIEDNQIELSVDDPIKFFIINKVNMISLKSVAANQTELSIDDTMVLFSYNTPVAYHTSGDWARITESKFSQTTTKHINQWLKRHGLENPVSVSQDTIESVLIFRG